MYFNNTNIVKDEQYLTNGHFNRLDSPAVIEYDDELKYLVAIATIKK